MEPSQGRMAVPNLTYSGIVPKLQAKGRKQGNSPVPKLRVVRFRTEVSM